MKKKIDIITILDVPNFGSMLQAYATGIIMERKGLFPEFIDYYRDDHSAYAKYKLYMEDKSLGNVIKRFVVGFGMLCFYSYIMGRLRKFVKRRFRFTKQYRTIEDLRKSVPQADIYLSGSDQIWNSQYNGGLDKSFYLDFTNGTKISYASSMGMDAYADIEREEAISLLKKYKGISVRESQTKEYFQNLGLDKVEHVLDPTLLISNIEWRDIIKYKAKRQERYLLVYSVERFNNDFIFSQAQAIAEELGLKMYVISATYPVKARKYNFDKIFLLADVATFIRLMTDAEFVVASSFHGTAFAINFNKDFITISADKFNIRMESLIDQFDIRHRIVSDKKVSISDLSPIDYNSINKKLESERTHSMSVIDSLLN